MWNPFPSSHCSSYDKASVTTISFQLFLVKSTMTSLVHYLIKYFQSYLNIFVWSFGPWNPLFLQLWWSHPSYLALLPIFLATPFHSDVNCFSPPIFKSVFPITSLRACDIPLPSVYHFTQRQYKVVNSPDLFLNFKSTYLLDVFLGQIKVNMLNIEFIYCSS